MGVGVGGSGVVEMGGGWVDGGWGCGGGIRWVVVNRLLGAGGG